MVARHGPESWPGMRRNHRPACSGTVARHGPEYATASTGAHAVGGQFGVYCASKYAVRAIMEGLRQETNKIRVTTLSPGVTESELGHDITVGDTKAAVKQLRSIALDTNAVANAINYVISQPADVDVNEIIIRTVRSAGHAF